MDCGQRCAGCGDVWRPCHARKPAGSIAARLILLCSDTNQIAQPENFNCFVCDDCPMGVLARAPGFTHASHPVRSLLQPYCRPCRAWGGALGFCCDCFCFGSMSSCCCFDCKIIPCTPICRLGHLNIMRLIKRQPIRTDNYA